MTKPSTSNQITGRDDEGATVDLNDQFRPTGPYGLAKSFEAKIARLEAERDTMPCSRRKAINRRLRELRDLLTWCKTRAGYVEPERGRE